MVSKLSQYNKCSLVAFHGINLDLYNQIIRLDKRLHLAPKLLLYCGFFFNELKDIFLISRQPVLKDHRCRALCPLLVRRQPPNQSWLRSRSRKSGRPLNCLTLMDPDILTSRNWRLTCPDVVHQFFFFVFFYGFGGASLIIYFCCCSRLQWELWASNRRRRRSKRWLAMWTKMEREKSPLLISSLSWHRKW